LQFPLTIPDLQAKGTKTMIYVVSDENLTETAKNMQKFSWFYCMSDAENAAKRFVKLNNEPCRIFSFVEHHTIEPEPKPLKFRLEFSSLVSDYAIIEATDLKEAIQIARDKFPKDEWELTRSFLIEE
jgi:hypothetical protein